MPVPEEAALLAQRLLRFAVLVGLALSGCGTETPAFPGAEGFGFGTPGGRGGQVLLVENLNDAGSGSLRAALATTGPRIVVFRVSGTITLKSPLEITSPFLTVAGQTAPGGGIQIRNEPYAPYGISGDSFQSIRIATHDVVLRYLRIRPGPLDPNPACTGPNALSHPLGYATCADAEDIRAIHILPSAHHVVLDHLSLAWTSDEIVAIQGATDVTLQWSILAEGMDFVLYEGFYQPPASTHSFGIITGDVTTARSGEPTNSLSLHHNLWAHNGSRNPQVMVECASASPSVACAADVVNNVVYNWRGLGTNLANQLGHTFANVEGNYFRPGPDTSDLNHVLVFNDWTRSVFAVLPNAALGVHVEGNRVETGPQQIADAPTQCNRWNQTAKRWEYCDLSAYTRPRQGVPGVVRSTAEVARDQVLAQAGASRRLTQLGAWRANRDATDDRLVQEFEAGSGRIIRSHGDFPGWPTLGSGTAPNDSDRDGMPSAWERAQCLDPHAPNHAADADRDVYTDLEEFLNGTLPTDLDRDEVPNHLDNCRSVANAGQRDDDPSPDGVGDACDCDFDADGDCDASDDAAFEACLASPGLAGCAAKDLNDDGALGASDSSLYQGAREDGLPGPSASECAY